HQVCKKLGIAFTQASRNLCRFGFGCNVQCHRQSRHISCIRLKPGALLNFDRKMRHRMDFTLIAELRSAEQVGAPAPTRYTSELQSHLNLVCRLLLEKKK